MKRKGLAVLGLVAGLSVLTSMSAFAGQWKQDERGWWWQNDDGSYPTSAWYQIDGNRDGVAEWYYFDSEGWLATNTTIDGKYTVNENGAWVKNGYVQYPAMSLRITPEIAGPYEFPTNIEYFLGITDDMPREESQPSTTQSESTKETSAETADANQGTMTSQEQFFSDLQDKYAAEAEEVLNDPEQLQELIDMMGDGGTAIGVR